MEPLNKSSAEVIAVNGICFVLIPQTVFRKKDTAYYFKSCGYDDRFLE